MGFIDRVKNPEKYKNTPKAALPLQTEFGKGDESDAWFIAWEVYELSPLTPANRQLKSFGSEIFTFPKGELPNSILLKVRESLGRHLGLRDVTRLEIDNGVLVSNTRPNPNIHITQFNRL